MTLRALFLSHSAHLGKGGGVQQCTMEYLDGIRTAGISVDVLPIESDRRIWVRAARQVNSSPYFKPIGRKDLNRIRTLLPDVDLILLNQVALAGALDELGPRGLGPARVLLSHGCEVTDMVHTIRLRKLLPISSRMRPTSSLALASVLADETRTRSLVDGVIAISPFDADCEAWLGTRRVMWVPRTVKSEVIDWSPMTGRYGYVGTLNHAPNLEGLVGVLDALEKRKVENLTIRIIGGPASIGDKLAKCYRSAEYLGELDDPKMRVESSSWSAFLHPIFCLPRGCSTKLATALSWRIPIITTTQGRRGYLWRLGSLIEANSPDEFVDEMYRLLDADERQLAKFQSIMVADSSPSTKEVAQELRVFLEDVVHSTTKWRQV